MINHDFDQYEHEENFDEDDDFPFIGQVKYFLFQRESGEFYAKRMEYTEEGIWVEV